MYLSTAAQLPRTRLGWATALVVFFSGTSLISGQPPEPKEKASMRVVTDRSAYEAGSVARIAVEMNIASGWHTNSHEPTFDYLIATSVRLSVPQGWSPAEIDYPPGEMKTFAFADDPISVYEGRVVMVGRLQTHHDASDGGWPITVALTYQACDDRSCLPPVTTSSTLQLQIGSQGLPSTDPVFTLSGTSGRAGRLGLPFMLAMGLVGGLILNAMPCVLPVLSLKVFGLVKSAGKGRTDVVVGSLATAMGILLSFWALALASTLARSAGAAVGWGVQFQEPVFVSALTIIVILFCLNLWGLFEIRLPVRLAQLADAGPKEGVPGHLASGLFATLMATPCSAPFLGTAVGFALSQDTGTVFAVFTAIGVGMALPYLLLAAFPATARFLPRPGPWMENLKIVMGFLLAGAAIWLLYVLAAQMSRERLAFSELALLALALFVWLRFRADKREILRLVSLMGIVLTIVLVLALAAGADSAAASQPETTSGLIPWRPFDRQQAERLAAAGHLVFVDVTADWCFTCKVNERLVLETTEVAAAFERHGVIPMKADWTNRSQAITVFLADHGRYGIPFYLLYRPQDEPHLFAELLTKQGLIRVVEEAALR